ncbi:MAG: DUF5110 domain-containing protein [Clostridia bacterium]|nr:DUF5110 domain-containing protein [Clostridia bacterium]
MIQTGAWIPQNDTVLRILPYSARIIRVTCGAPDAPEPASFSVTAPMPADPVLETRAEDGRTIVSAGELTVTAGESGVTIRCGDERLTHVHGFSLTPYEIKRQTGGDVTFRQTVDGLRASREGGGEEFVRQSNHGTVTFDFTEDETLFGLGSHEEGFPNLRGQFVPLYQENMRIAVPVFVSTKGYAVLVNCASVMTFDATDHRRGKFFLDSVDAVDFWFLWGGDYAGVCRELRSLTGVTPMLPKWAFGYVQSKERYGSEEELLSIARRYREEGIPIDVLVQDWPYWDDGLWGNKHFDRKRYPDPQALTDALHGMDLRLMISIWPNLSGESEDRIEMRGAGYLLGDGSTVNAFDEDARALYWKQAYEGLFRYGIDGWWCDSSEPFDAVWGGRERAPLPERMAKSVGEFKKYLDDAILNVYSLHHAKGMYENQRKNSEKRVVNLTRSGFSGQHRYGTVVWSGDVSANWETLRRQVRVMQNYVATGEAYWNSDIGSFFASGGYEWFRDGDYPEGCNDPAYRELYTRWLQFAAFTPMMRSHGTNTPREVWRFGERGTPYRDAIERAIRLRYALLPYLYSVHAAVTFDGTMPVTPLALAYPHDREAAKASGEYLYGPSLLVCPVTDPGADSVTVYLPEGGWYDYETEKFYAGGQYVKIPVSIERIPLFVKAGAILPVAPPVQSTAELAGKPYELRIYAPVHETNEADGTFTLYDDGGLDYAYEEGDYTAVTYAYRTDGTVTETLAGKPAWRHDVTVRVIGLA